MPRSLGSCCCSIEAKAQLRSITRVVGLAVFSPSSIESHATASKCSHMQVEIGTGGMISPKPYHPLSMTTVWAPTPYRPGNGIDPPYLGDREEQIEAVRGFLRSPRNPRNVLITGLRG